MDRDKLKEKIAEAITRMPLIGSSLEYAEAALAAIEEAGYAIVPKEPTSEMIAKVHWLGETSVREVYAAMLAGVKFKEPSDG